MSIDPIGIRISGPLAGFAEGYGTELTQLGYAAASVRLQMNVLADLSDWLLSHGMAAADLRRSDLDRFPLTADQAILTNTFHGSQEAELVAI